MVITNIPKITRRTALQSPIKNKGNAINRQYARTSFNNEQSLVTALSGLPPIMSICTHCIPDYPSLLSSFGDILGMSIYVILSQPITQIVNKLTKRVSLNPKMDEIIKRANEMPRTMVKFASKKIKNS